MNDEAKSSTRILFVDDSKVMLKTASKILGTEFDVITAVGSCSDVRARRVTAIGELRGKLDLYRGLLSGMADRISGEISQAETALLEALARPAPAEEEAAVA